MNTTCAMTIINEYNEVLAVHPTGLGSIYSLPKGINEPDEDYIDTAYRELYEETNIDMNDIMISPYPTETIHEVDRFFYYKHKNKKMKGFYIFLPKYIIDKIELKCYSYVNKHNKSFPEVDEYKWLSIDKGEYEMLHETQVSLIDYIMEDKMDHIKIEECIHGALYELDARNVHVGIFDCNDNSFMGIRRKFSQEFLDKEIHYDADDKHGTAKPLAFIENSSFKQINSLTTERYMDMFNYINERR